MKRSTVEFARLKPQPERAEPPEPADAEPVVRATHVEAPSPIEEQWDDEIPRSSRARRSTPRTARRTTSSSCTPPPPARRSREELTPQGNVRSTVTEADDNTYTSRPPAT